MANILISRAAHKDLMSIQTYIRDELLNPTASKSMLMELKKTILSLHDFPEREKLLDSVLTVHTDFRFLICEPYQIFYRMNGENVEIVRVLHRLQDYMHILFN